MIELGINGGKPVRSKPMPSRFAFGLKELFSLLNCLYFYRRKGLDPGYQNFFENSFEDLNLHQKEETKTELLIDAVKECEDIALSTKGISNSEGAEASYSTGEFFLATSNGFRGGYKSSINSISKALAISVSHSLNSNLSCVSILPSSFKLFVFLFGGGDTTIPLLQVLLGVFEYPHEALDGLNTHSGWGWR